MLLKNAEFRAKKPLCFPYQNVNSDKLVRLKNVSVNALAEPLSTEPEPFSSEPYHIFRLM